MYFGKGGGSIMGRKTRSVLGILALVLGLSALGSAQTRTLTILHTNDTHSAMLPFTHQPYPTPFTWLWPDHRQGWQDEFRGPAGFNREYAGIARMSTLIKKIRATKNNVLAFHAGDVFVGSFEFNKYLGYPDLKIMENLYDAMTPGNHEFDLGMDLLAAVLTGTLSDPAVPAVQLPLLNANYNLAGHALDGLIQESMIKTFDGVKVGIFGIGNEDETNFSAEMIARFSGNPFEVAGIQAAILRAAGCQVVICLSHLGTLLDTGGLSQVPGIDIIVGGHSHDLFRKAVLRNGKIIVQAGSHNRYLGELQVAIVPGGGVKYLSWKAHEVDKNVKPDPTLKAQLDMIRLGVIADPRFGDVYGEPVAYAFRDISQEWPSVGPNRDAPLGNLVSDAMRAALTGAGLPVDCVLDPMGYTEFGIPAGKIVGNDIMRAVPYGYDPGSGLGFKLVVAPFRGQDILSLLEYTLTYVEYTDSLCVQPSGLTFAYDSSKAPSSQLGALSRLDPMSVKIGNEYVAANLQKVYYVGLTDQVFKYLNNLVGGGLFKIDSGIFEYDAVRDYLESLHFVSYASEGRVLDLAPAATAATAAPRRK
jgi:2',3'-cyclic-nucleotide 2'-phosphodiesterase (5'-nucleotidase family)